ncbi:MAG: hypothetical protein HY064_16140 [Bacteroidetes bacterium]|nr:hypothetical protein [Bacteroidota bacterium]
MRKIILLLFIPGFSAFAQSNGRDTLSTKNCSVDLDMGLEFMRIENPGISRNLLFNDSLHRQTFMGYCGGLEIYRRVAYVNPQWSVGFFVKPFFGTNMHRHSFMDSWLGLQLPIGIATEFGKTDGHSPGIMFGAAVDLNVFDFADYHVPVFYKPLPYFFVQVHEGQFGIRFSGSPAQIYSNTNGTTTKTSYNFEIALVATSRF